MVRATLIVFATLATFAAVVPAAAQAGAPVRTLGAPDAATNSTVLIVERKAPACTAENCSSRPKRGYVAAAPLGW
jgi:hypothetical protein